MRHAILLVAMAVLLAAGPTTQTTQPGERGRGIADDLKADIAHFDLRLVFLGDWNKPYYSVVLSVPQLPKVDTGLFYEQAQITQEQATTVIDALAASGALDRLRRIERHPVKWDQPCYLLTVHRGSKVGGYHGSLGFDLNTLRHLDALRATLDGEAAKSMDLLLGRLSGHRAEWEKAAK